MITNKDLQIQALTKELDKANKRYIKLFEENKKLQKMIEFLEDKLNTILSHPL